MPNDVMPWRDRVQAALAVLRGARDGAPDGRVATGGQTRAIIDTTFPNVGIGQAALVRTANPQEYKPEGATVRMQGFSRHPVVHACIRVVADIVASVPLVVLSAKGDMETRVPESHPLQRLLDYPGPRMTARGMRARYAVDFIGYGNAFFQLERPSPGRPPVGIRSINAEAIQTVWVDSDGDARRYDYGNWAGIVVQVPVEDVLHFRDLDMPRPFTPDVFGFPRGATAIASMAADNEATQYVRQVVTNDGTPTFAVLLSDQASQDDALAMQDRYRARVVDRGKRGTPAFFGAVRDIKPLGFTLSDLEFPSLRKVSREDICAAYGVDPRMIGIASATSDAGLSGAQYAEARQRLVQHTIEPMLSAIEDELNNWLAPEFGDVWITYDRDVLRELTENDTETSDRVRAEFKDSLRTWEESRRALGLSPTPEPTDTLAMTTGTTLVPAATAVIDPRAILIDPDPAEAEQIDGASVGSAMGAVPEDIQASALNGAQTTALIDMLGLVASGELPFDTVQAVITAAFPGIPAALIQDMLTGLSGFTPPSAEAALPAQRRDRAAEEAFRGMWWQQMTAEQLAVEPRYMQWRRAMNVLDAREDGFFDEAVAEFHVEREQVGAMFSVGTRARKTKEQILDEIARRIADDYAPGGEYYAAWRERFLKLVGDTYMAGAGQVDATAALSFSLESPEVLAAITKRSSTLAGLVGETTSKNILSAMRAGELGGFSVAEIGRLVQASVFNETVTDARARTIARTESAGAMSQGNWDQAKAMGDLYRSKEWLAFEDDKTRETHTACMAQGRIPFDERFSNGLDYPLDPAGSAAEVINCFPAGTAVEGKVVGGLKADYAGKFIEIVTERGHRLTVTPNHPILTDTGWVAAHAITEGTRLFSKTCQVETVARGVLGNNQQDGPARIEDVFNAMAGNGAVRSVQVSKLHLHGDAIGTKGAVDVVGANRVLEIHVADSVDEGVKNFDFSVAESGIRASGRSGAFDALGQAALSATAGVVGGADLALHQGGVLLDGLPFEQLRIGATAHGNPVFAQASKQDIAAVPAFIGQLLETYAADIAIDQVLFVRDYEAQGHIYDLQTEDGWIIAQGIVTSNCRCVLAYYDTTVEEAPR